jgi:predicted  nucleic acid-binding Zn-ribbon protein
MTHGYTTYGDDPEFEAEYAEYPDTTRRDLEELFAAVDGLRTAVEDVDTRDAGLRQEFTALADRLDHGDARSQEHRLDQLGRRLERLQQQVQALERAVRGSDGVPRADLDDVGAETRALAAQAARWDDLHKELVTKEQRARH